jgi:hypothetical protein
LSGRAKRRLDGNLKNPSALGDDFLLGEIQDEQAPAVEEKERKGEWIKKDAPPFSLVCSRLGSRKTETPKRY